MADQLSFYDFLREEDQVKGGSNHGARSRISVRFGFGNKDKEKKEKGGVDEGKEREKQSLGIGGGGEKERRSGGLNFKTFLRRSDGESHHSNFSSSPPERGGQHHTPHQTTMTTTITISPRKHQSSLVASSNPDPVPVTPIRFTKSTQLAPPPVVGGGSFLDDDEEIDAFLDMIASTPQEENFFPTSSSNSSTTGSTTTTYSGIDSSPILQPSPEGQEVHSVSKKPHLSASTSWTSSSFGDLLKRFYSETVSKTLLLNALQAYGQSEKSLDRLSKSKKTSKPALLDSEEFLPLKILTVEDFVTGCCGGSVAAVLAEDGTAFFFGGTESSSCQRVDVVALSCGQSHFATITKQGVVFAAGNEVNDDVIAVRETSSCADSQFAEIERYKHQGHLGHFKAVRGENYPFNNWDAVRGVMIPADEVSSSSISCGGAHTAVLTSNSLTIWGLNDEGQCGHALNGGKQMTQSITALFGFGVKIKQVVCGGMHTMALDDEGRVYGWGSNKYGQTGTGASEIFLTSPVQAASIAYIRGLRISCGFQHTVVVSVRGEVLTCGSNHFGELGRKGSGQMFQILKLLSRRATCIEASCGTHSTSVIDDLGCVYVWGKGMGKNLGSNSEVPRLLHNLESKFLFVKKFAIGNGHYLAMHDPTLTELLREIHWTYYGDSSSRLDDLGISIPARQRLRQIFNDRSQRNQLNQCAKDRHGFLDLSRHCLSDLSISFTDVTFLTTLNLCGNFLKTLPPALSVLISLQRLDLACNNLTSLPVELGCLINLQFVDLSSNQLTELPFEIGSWRSLLELRVRTNKLERLVESIGSMDNLEILDVCNNQLDALPKQLGSLRMLKSFLVTNNPLKSIPSELKCRGGMAILSWLNALSAGTKPCFRIKLMIVGEGNVGKTSLVNSLLDRNRKKGKRQSTIATDGIDINNWVESATNASAGKCDITFNVWDFAGQEVYYATHHFFLSNRAIYLVTFNLLEDNLCKVDYWLRSIQSKVNQAPVILVGTHLDDKLVTPAYIEEVCSKLSYQFCSRYKNVLGATFVSTKTDKGIEELRNKLTEVALSQPYMGEEFPNSYLSLEEQVAIASKINVPPVITWQEWEKMGEKCGISSADISAATELLHELGVVVHFKEKSRNLDNIVILDPQFITRSMASIISLKSNMVKEGILKSSDLPLIWRPPEFPSRIHSNLIDLLETFEVLFALESTGQEQTFLIPAMLRLNRSLEVSELWPHFDISGTQLTRIIQFQFIPIGLFSRLITRILYIGKPITYWQTGIVFSAVKDDAKALVECLDSSFAETPQIKVEVRGKQPLKLLRVIQSFIEALIDEFFPSERPINWFAACPHCNLRKKIHPYLFPIPECVRAITEHQVMVFCNGYSPVLLRTLVPDLAMTDVPKIDYHDITVEKEIGRGGFGVIYKGTLNGATVAIKKLLLSSDPEEEESTVKFTELYKEASYMNLLQHPNLVQLRGVCTDPICLVAEFVSCGDLFNFLQASQSQPPNRKLTYRIAVDIARGMSFLHSLFPPIIHRDMKSPNILLASLDPNAAVIAKVADLGIATMVTKTMKGGGDTTSDWQPPEVLFLEEYNQSADVYGFGIILWELWTRKLPFAEYNFKSTFRKRDAIKRGTRPTIPDTCPIGWAKLTQDCWGAHPALRPSFSEVLQRLNSIKFEMLGDETDILFQQVIELSPHPSRFNRQKTLNKMLTMMIDHGNVKMEVNSSPLVEFSGRHQVSEGAVESMIYALGTVWQGCRDGSIRVWSVKKWEAKSTELKKHKKGVISLLYLDKLKQVWSFSVDGLIVVWNAETKAAEKTLDLKNSISCVLKKGKNIWFACKKSIYVWQIAGLKQVKEFPIDQPVTYMTKYKTFVWIALADGSLERWTSTFYQKVDSFRAHLDTINVALINEEQIWTASNDGNLCIWDAVGGSLIDKLDRRKIAPKALFFLNNFCICGYADGGVVFWDTKLHKMLYEYEDSSPSPHPISAITGWKVSNSPLTQIWAHSNSVLVLKARDSSSSTPLSTKTPKALPKEIEVRSSSKVTLAFSTGAGEGLYILDGEVPDEKEDLHRLGLTLPESVNCPFANGMSISTLETDLTSGVQVGEPNADGFFVEMLQDYSIIGIADGLGWGESSRMAAVSSLYFARRSLKQKFGVLASLQPSLGDVASLVTGAITEASLAITDGCTSIGLGTVLKIESPESEESSGSWGVLVGCVGSVRVLLWSRRAQRINEVTETLPDGFIGRSKDVGQLKMSDDSFDHDIHLHYLPCEVGDIVFMLTDGIYKNMMPDHLNCHRGGLEINYTDFFHQLLEDIILPPAIRSSSGCLESVTSELSLLTGSSKTFSSVTPKDITERLIQFTKDVTDEKRQILSQLQETKTAARGLKDRASRCRGLLDHSTCVAVSVGHAYSSEEVTGDSVLSPRSLVFHRERSGTYDFGQLTEDDLTFTSFEGQNKHMVKEGMLRVGGGTVGSWHEFWVVLNQKAIELHKKPKDKTKPVEQLWLKSSCTVKISPEQFEMMDSKSGKLKKQKKPNVFVFGSEQGASFYMQSSSAVERNQWIHAISTNLQLVNFT